jgi:polyhydroxybutyrate depolymerase
MKPRHLALAPVLALSLLHPAAGARLTNLQVDTADGKRSLILAQPDAVSAGPHPLVLVLHGHGGTAENALGRGFRPSPLSAWLAIVDREDVIVAAMQGATDGDGKPGWNDCRGDAPGNPKTDDVGFARAVVQEVARRGLLDETRVYAMGMSNGAMMAQRLAIELDPPIAGFAAVAGTLGDRGPCGRPHHKVSALLINGDHDPLVPYDGGDVHFFDRKRGHVLSVEANVAFWLRADGIESRAVEDTLPKEAGTGDPTRAVRSLYGSPADAPQVELIRIEGGGHVEPSLRYHYGPVYAHIVGEQNRDFESAEEAWRFLRTKRARPLSGHNAKSPVRRLGFSL